MAVILDTDLLQPQDRAEAVGPAMQQSGIPAKVTHEPRADGRTRRAGRTVMLIPRSRGSC